jgi:hypothetical protein
MKEFLGVAGFSQNVIAAVVYGELGNAPAFGSELVKSRQVREIGVFPIDLH